MKLLLADSLLVVHCLFILFVLGGQACILIGGWRGWSWVRHRAFRFIHLAAIGLVMIQAWLGMICFLTIWEDELRRAAGEATYNGTFISYWVGRLVYWDAPPWVFTVAYTVFGALVVASWILVRPARARAGKSSQ